MTEGDGDARVKTEEGGRDYFEERVRQLEAENAALVQRADALARRIDHLDQLITSMSRAAQAFRVLRTGIRRPGSFVRLPANLLSVARQRPAVAERARGPGPAPEAASTHARDDELLQVSSALRAHERRVTQTERRDPSSLRVALIADDVLARGLGPECEVVPVVPNGWRPDFERARPDLLLVQSAWRGQAGAWQYRVGWFPHPDSYRLAHLRAIVEWCREAGVPTVFWSTEDPQYLGRFEAAARLFDHVFTVDAGSIPRLEDLPGRRAARIGHLPMAAQPRLHNPTGRADEPASVAFIGAYDRGAPVAQRGDLELLLDAGARARLTIYDRKLGADSDLFGFPDRYRDLVAPWLAVTAIPNAIRAHRAILGTPDAAAVPARVFESLACGRPVVTTWRAAAARTFADGVLAGATAADLDAVLADVAAGDPAIDDAADRAIADIMRTHTYRHRLATIAREVGYDVAATPPPLALVCQVDEETAVDRLVDVVSRLGDQIQEVVVGTTDDDVVARACRERVRRVGVTIPVHVIHQTADDSATRFRRLAAAVSAPWAHLCDVRQRGPVATLEPLLAALAYADADVVGAPVGRRRWYGQATDVCPAAAIVRQSALVDLDWHLEPAAAADAMASWSARGVRIYAVAALPEGATA